MTRGALRLVAKLSPDAAAAWAARRFTRPPRADDRAALPGARRTFLDSAVGRLAVHRWGDEGPIALLVHGFGGHAGDLLPYVEPLRARGYQVLALDAPAHGASAGRHAGLPVMAEAVSAVARAAGRPEVVVAHALGATACALAAQRGMKVARMAWIAPAASVAAAARGFAEALAMPAELRARFVGAVEQELGASLEALELSAIAPAQRAPVLIVHDRDDDVAPVSQSIRAAEALPVARLAVTRGLGHRRILAAAPVVRAAVAFVDDLAEAVHDPAPVALEALAGASAIAAAA